jgi:hypothetical protein
MKRDAREMKTIRAIAKASVWRLYHQITGEDVFNRLFVLRGERSTGCNPDHCVKILADHFNPWPGRP